MSVVIQAAHREVADFSIGGRYESLDLVASDVCAWARGSRALLFVPDRLRKYVKAGAVMIYVTAVVAAFVFGYLVAAMVRPEWF